MYSQAATEIQRVWRGHVESNKFCGLIWSAVLIQASIRVFLSKNLVGRMYIEQDVEYLLCKRSAALIQRRFRHYLLQRLQSLAATIIQSKVRCLIILRRTTRQKSGLIRFQGMVRGHVVRNHRAKKMLMVVDRIAKANAKALMNPSMRLDNRCAAALRALRRSDRLSHVTAAIKTLETATRLSEVCCRSFVDARAGQIILGLIETCNRSVPHVEILHYTMMTLANITRHHYLVHSIATELAVGKLLDLVQMFRDNDSIFVPAAALLELAVFYDQSLLSLCQTKENMKRLDKLIQLGEKKLDHHLPMAKLLASVPRPSHVQHTTRSTASHVHDSAQGLSSLKRVFAAISKK